MRPKLLRETRQRPHERRGRGTRHRRAIPAPPVSVMTRTAARGYDPVVVRVKQAGGPIDNASYSCECGYVFRASVSTTVSCPHCGVGQAW